MTTSVSIPEGAPEAATGAAQGAQPAPAATPPAAAPAPSTGSTAAPERPSWLPSKFANAEAMAKSYAELEKMVSGKGTPGVNSPPANPSSEQAAKELADAGLDVAPFLAEYAKDKKLSDGSLAKLEAAGISRTRAAEFIKGEEAKVEQTTTRILSGIGGKAEFDKATAWAKANLPTAEIKAFNASVNRGEEEARLAVAGLYARFKGHNPQEPNLSGGGNGNGVGTFENPAQLTAAMRDPRYRTDPSYRAEVERKVAGSKLFGM